MNRILPLLNIAMITIAIALVSTQAFAVDIVTSVDRNPVSADESFKIFFTATDTPDNDPDFSPLEQDFSIINQSQSSSSSWVNGSYSKSIRWTLEVTAKTTGNLVIPAIQFGNDTSNPLPVIVNQGTSNSDTFNTDQDLFLDVKATPEQPYVQSQVLYTLRLYRRVDIAQAELSEPELTDAVVEKLGEDSNYNTVVNGVSYLVTERKYAIFPQKSGVMKIKPLTLTAQVIVNSQPDFSDFFGSRMTKTKRILSKEVVLEVKPKPAGFTGKDWLAAEKLELTQEWSGNTQQMKVGEPVTRTLTLQGVGTTVGQLPELSATKPDANLKAYPDQPVLNEHKLPEGISASRQEKIAIIPATTGKYVLPAIEIPWFNTKSQTMAIARLPETTVNVIGANENQTAVKPPHKSSAVEAPSTTSLQRQTVATNENTQQKIWPWVSLFLAFGWFVTVIYFLQKKPENRVIEDKAARHLKQEAGLKQTIKKLKEACADDDAKEAKDAVLAWGKEKFNADSLGSIADCCDARLRDEIILLNQSLYGKNKSGWNGKKFLQAFTENNARANIVQIEEQVLEPLHRL